MSSEKERIANLSTLKREFARRFPDSPLMPILLSEPDEVSFGDLLAKASTWLSLLRSDKRSDER